MATKNINPRANGEGSIGTDTKKWGAGYFSTLFVDGNGIVDTSNASNISSGTLSDSILSANVAFLDAANIFIKKQTVRLTTTQAEWGYDSSNYAKLTIDSTGTTVLQTAGSLAKLVLSPASNLVEQRNGNIGQALYIYNKYTDDANYERINFSWNSDTFNIAGDSFGVATPRIISISGQSRMQLTAGNELRLGAGGVSNRWQLNTNGHFVPQTNAEFDIGSGSSRLRYLYVTDIYLNSYIRNIAGQALIGSSRELFDGNGYAAVNWQNRHLLNSNGQVNAAWNSHNLFAGGVDSVNWANRILFNSAGNVSVDWNSGYLYSSSTSNVVMDWSSRLLLDNAGQWSVDWNARQLLTADGSVALDWSNGVVTGGGALPSVEIITEADWAASQTFYITLTGNTDINFANAQDGKAISVVVTPDGFIPTFTDTISWQGGVAPIIPASGKILYTFMNINGDLYATYIKYITGGEPIYLAINDSNTGQILVSGGHYIADTTVATFAVLLPANPSIGDTIVFSDAQSTWPTNVLTVNPNGNSLDGVAAPVDFNLSNIAYAVVYVGGAKGWNIYA